jgi:hypothetical protein
MPQDLGGDAQVSQHHRAPTISSHRVLFVRVCGFTFRFHTTEELIACLEFYEQKLHPSSRSAEAAAAVADETVGWRWHVERWYERLPLYLREEPKREQVVAALAKALRQREAGKV